MSAHGIAPGGSRGGTKFTGEAPAEDVKGPTSSPGDEAAQSSGAVPSSSDRRRRGRGRLRHGDLSSGLAKNAPLDVGPKLFACDDQPRIVLCISASSCLTFDDGAMFRGDAAAGFAPLAHGALADAEQPREGNL